MNIHEAIERLQKEGHQVTNRRKDMLTFFAKADGYRTAKDLLTFMDTIYAGISIDTIYRNLNLYHELGILEVTELDGERHFRMTCGDHHHHHFICTDCGKTKPIPVCPMDEVKESLDNYVIEDHKFEIYGLCPLCHTA